MKKVISILMAMISVLLIFSGCGAKDAEPQGDVQFTKPESYMSVIRITINPSFDLYLDEDLKILAVEPKNEDAKQLPLESVAGKEMRVGVRELLGAAYRQGFYVDGETVATLDFIEGEQTVAEVDIIELAMDACDDAIAKETVNATMDSAIMARLNEQYGCECRTCKYLRWNKIKYLTTPIEWEQRLAEWEQQREALKRTLDSLDPNSEEYQSYLKMYNKIRDITPTIDVVMDEYRERYLRGYFDSVHKEKVITYEIADEDNPIIRPDGKEKVVSKELTPEGFLETFPEFSERADEFQKMYRLNLKVYINGEGPADYFRCWVFQINEKWYEKGGLGWSWG